MELVAMFKKGDESAFDELVRIHSSKAFQIAFAMLGCRADAEEIVQDAFMKVYKNLVNFRGDSSFTTWLYRIVVNLAKNKYRWHRSRGAGLNMSMSEAPEDMNGVSADIEIPDNSMLPDAMLQSRESGHILLRALKALPLKLREVIVLRHVDELPYEAIADSLGCELGTVKSRLARAREALRQAIEKEHGYGTVT